MEVNISPGAFYIQKKINGDRTKINTLGDALAQKANCGPCGCDECLGYWTNYDATTGELVVLYVSNGVVVTAPYDEGIVTLKALKAVRDAS